MLDGSREIQTPRSEELLLPSTSPLLRGVLLVGGGAALLLGVVGIFLPLLPTVPLLLLAAACFARSSPRCHRWLLEHAHLGPLIHGFLSGEGIPRRVRQRALVLVWVSISLSAWWAPLYWVKGMLVLVAVGVTAYLLRLPTRAA